MALRHFGRWLSVAVRAAVTGAVLSGAVTPVMAEDGQGAARPVVASPEPALDRRMKVLARELKLTDEQQGKIRHILESQRDAVRRIWTDPSVLPAERAAVTQAQNERTGDEIRGVLTDEQKRLYNRSRRDNPLPAGEKHSVEQWMDAATAPRPGTH